MAVEPYPRGKAPFDTSGIERDAAGVAHYSSLPTSLVTMLRASVERYPDGEALVEVGGERLTYRQLWDRAARVAGVSSRPASAAGTGWPMCCPPGPTGCSRSSARSWPARSRCR